MTQGSGGSWGAVIGIFLIVGVIYLIQMFMRKTTLDENGEISYTRITRVDVGIPDLVTFQVHFKNGVTKSVSVQKGTSDYKMLKSHSIN